MILGLEVDSANFMLSVVGNLLVSCFQTENFVCDDIAKHKNNNLMCGLDVSTNPI